MKTEDYIKTTFVLRKEVYDENFKKYLFHGIGRDAFVSLHLRDALCELAKSSKLVEYKNTGPKAMAVNRAIRRFDVTTKRSFKLLREDVEAMNKLCKEKGILRDVFFEGYLTFLGRVLKEATRVLENPFNRKGSRS